MILLASLFYTAVDSNWGCRGVYISFTFQEPDVEPKVNPGEGEGISVPWYFRRLEKGF